MTDQALAQALPRALLVLRITLGLFLLQWGVEKFVVPQNTVAIWSHFYGLNVSQALGYLFGAAEIAIAVCLFLGLFRTPAYGAAVALHAVSVLVSWRQLLDPWGRSREPFVHRQRPGAGRAHRPVPAPSLGPEHPGGRRAGGAVMRGALRHFLRTTVLYTAWIIR
jgi:putative oxidoreductase